jgi:hypothetical protein
MFLPGMARMATQVLTEAGNERPGFSKAVSENSIPNFPNSSKGLIVSTDLWEMISKLWKLCGQCFQNYLRNTVNAQYPDDSGYLIFHFGLNRIWITGRSFDNQTLIIKPES